MHRKWASYMAGWLCGAALSTGCSSPDAEVAGYRSAVLGQSGDRTVSGQEVVNQYAVLATNAVAGSRAITLQDLGALPGLKAGDVLFIIQMQGAAIDLLSDAARNGEVLDIRNAGHYELVTVTGVDATAGSVQVRSHGTSGLQYDYTAAGRTQVVLVPQYQNLTVPTGATLAASPWNGSTGGVVVVTADNVQVEGTISASGMGFRGGQMVNGTSPVSYLGYRTTDGSIAGARGEGVGGSVTDYAITGSYGRAAAANGGGGGNNINCPGGGGANALAPGKLWTGQGVMDISQANYRTAWRLDPAYDATNQLFADSAGGGRGGYACSSAALDPLTVGPSDPTWGCGIRTSLGGLGGRPLLADVRRRLYLGGGGGAGQSNNNNGGSGGNGGGMVFVLARTIAGQGSITADGAAGGASGFTAGVNSDGPGGGGGGGTVVLLATQTISAVKVSALGGVGGNMSPQANPAEGEGGGGGGGGGFVALVGQATSQPAVTGGAAGRTLTPGFSTFPMNGATGGAVGAVNPATTLNQDFLPPVYAADLQVTLGLGSTDRPGYTRAPFYANYTNLGPDPAANVRATITLPPGIPGIVSRSGIFTCTQQDQIVTCTAPELAVNQTEIVEIFLDLPRDPQGQFTVSANVAGGGFDYNAANDNSTLTAQISGYVQLSGNGVGCTMNRSTGGSAAAFWSLLLLCGVLLAPRRRAAGLLCLLGGLALAPACSLPPKPQINVAITVVGQGSVSSIGGAINCGTQCQTVTDPGTELALTATPTSGNRFVKWEGRCQGAVPTCDLNLLNDAQATATFEPIPVTCFDGIKNAGETDLDCGGACAPCEDGRSCAVVGDCQSAQCVTGICSSCPIAKELIINGGAEDGPVPGMYLPGWAVNPQMTGLPYGTAGFLQPGDPGPTSRGTYFFYGGATSTSTATQGIDLTHCAALIDKGVLSYTASGWFGGFPGQDDNARLALDFFDRQSRIQASSTLGPVLNSDRGGAAALLQRTSSADVASGTRTILITLTTTRTAGVSNDGYADNLSLILNLK